MSVRVSPCALKEIRVYRDLGCSKGESRVLVDILGFGVTRL